MDLRPEDIPVDPVAILSDIANDDLEDTAHRVSAAKALADLVYVKKKAIDITRDDPENVKISFNIDIAPPNHDVIETKALVPLVDFYPPDLTYFISKEENAD